MQYNIFEELYKDIQIPVIVCDDDRDMTVMFANTNAYILLNPSLTVERIGAGLTGKMPLSHLMHFQDIKELENIRQVLKNTGSLSMYSTVLLSSGDMRIHVNLVANRVHHENLEYNIFYIFHVDNNEEKYDNSNEILLSVLNTSFHVTDIDKAVHSIISIAGAYIGVSRVYIFEDLFNNFTRNTYEWCAPGIEPAISDLQNLCKDDYNYDAIVNSSGMYITGDIKTLPENDRVILEPQGIKAIAILPLFHFDMPIGYIGYDDCENIREWTLKELNFLKNITGIVSSLIIRRNAETNVQRSSEILQTITDNTDSIIYVNDLKTYEIKFVNHALATSLGVEADKIINKKCWQVLQKDMTEPCPFCPIPKLLDETGNPNNTVYQWEHRNTVTGSWFWIKDSVIRWIDGNPVHFEIAMNITLRKQYEEQLQYYASLDTMTETFNREWGYTLLQKIQEESRMTGAKYTLCFIDLDGLKITNDTFGHNAGDDMILSIVKKIKGRIRKDDMICRWGGDEFLLLLKCNVQNADIVIKSIQADLEKVNSQDTSGRPPLSFSYGIADFTSADNIDTVVTMADHAMYENKMAKRRK